MTQSTIQPKMYIGVLLSINDFRRTIESHLGQYLSLIDMGATVRCNLHNYFYCEQLPIHKPIDQYLGGMVVYNCNPEALPREIRNPIVSTMADLQWVLHDYISLSIQAILGINVVRENEYYYTLDQHGRLMVYVPLAPNSFASIGVSPVPEAAVVYSCFHTLPIEKRLAFAGAVSKLTPD